MQSLWTKDFTIITLGSAVSMIGNALIGFAISLLVLDYTDAPFLYALFVFFYTLPQIVMPVIAGPFMDRFSRRRTIYLLDFFSAALYLGTGILLYFGTYNFLFLITLAVATGSIFSFYSVAFSSFYPLLITEGNYSKAYSVSSTLETFSQMVIPISTFLYNLIGIVPILLISSSLFLIAALMETRISDVEAKQENLRNNYGMKQYIDDSKEGIRYLWMEKGLLFITIYFVIYSISMGASQVITLPWFRGYFDQGEYIYIFVWGFMVIGRIIGSILQYRFKVPSKWKYSIALFVYLLSSLIEGTYLFTPIKVMQILCFFMGLFSAISYNIRISATQNYVPDEKRGRYNGTFLMLTTCGTLLGEFLTGIITSFLPMRPTLSVFMTLPFFGAILIIGGGKKHIEKVYHHMN